MKFFTALLLFSFFALTVSGQNHFIGAKGGFSLTDASISQFPPHQTQPGFSVGLTYDFVTKRKISFGAELLYEKRGFATELIFTNALGNPTGEKHQIRYRYDYITIPLKVGYSIGSKIFGFANIGFCPALLQNAKTTLPIFQTNLKYVGDTTYNVTKNVSKFDISGLAEIGCGYKLSNRFLIATAFRFQYSFTSLTNAYYFSNTSIRNYAMTVSLGIKYNMTYKSPTLPEQKAK